MQLRSPFENEPESIADAMVDRRRQAALACCVVMSGLIALAIATGFAQPANSGNDQSDFMTMSLEELGSVKVPTVTGASKHEQKTTDAPSSVSIVTQEDIKEYGYRTLGDLLRSVRGFYVTYDRSYNYTGLRGVNRPGDFGGRVLINIDGHRLNEPIFDSAFTHTDFLLDMDLVERVEVIRGPGSSLYGNNAFFTVINVITRNGRSVGGVEVSGAAASYDTYTGRLTYGNKFTNGLELLVSGTYLNSAGQEKLFFPEYSSVNNGIAEHLDGSEAKSTFASLAYRDFKLEGGFIDRRKAVPSAQFPPFVIFNDPHALDVDERAYAELKFEHHFEHDASLQARAYYDHYRFDGTVPLNNNAPAPGPVTLNHDLDHAQWFGAELIGTKTLWERQRLTVGGEVREDFQLDVSNFDVSPSATLVNSRRREFSFAFYGQDEVTILTNLALNAGVRYDHFSTFGGTVNPRGALIYNPWRQSTFKFIYGEAFRAPNAYELYYVQPTFKANPDLRPETIRSYELVYEQGLGDHWRWSGSLFLNQIKGLIGQTSDANGTNFFDNLDQVEARGIETEMEGRWNSGWRTRLSYTYTEARDTATDQILDNSPRHLGKANLAVPLWRDKVFGGLELQAMSGRRTVLGNHLGAFWLANFTLYSRELVRNLEFSASIYNLFDRKYADPVSTDYLEDRIRQDGRSFRVKLTYKF